MVFCGILNKNKKHMKTEITSAIDMRKIKNQTQAIAVLNIIIGYIMGIQENPNEKYRSQYLVIRKDLNNLRGKYPIISKKVTEEIDKINSIILGLNRIHQSRIQNKRNGGRYGIKN